MPALCLPTVYNCSFAVHRRDLEVKPYQVSVHGELRRVHLVADRARGTVGRFGNALPNCLMGSATRSGPRNRWRRRKCETEVTKVLPQMCEQPHDAIHFAGPRLIPFRSGHWY